MTQMRTPSKRWGTVFLAVLILVFLLLTIPYVPLRSSLSRAYSGGIWEEGSGVMTAEVTASLEAVRTRYLLRSQANEITGTVTLEGGKLDGDHTLYLRQANAESAEGWVFQSPALDQGAHSTTALGPYQQTSFGFREDFSAVVVRLRQGDTRLYLVLTDGDAAEDVLREYIAAADVLTAP